jgi:hypothetical protein
MEITCNTHQLAWKISKKLEPSPALPPYSVGERHQLTARESYAEHVIKRRRRKIASQAFSRLVAEVQAHATSRERLSTWLDTAEKTLNRFAKLEPNWDGYGARPINPAVIQEARDLIARIADHINEAPVIVPTPRGSIQLEWHRGPRCLELEFESKVMIHYLKWDPAAGIEDENLVTIYEERKILSLLDWFESK